MLAKLSGNKVNPPGRHPSFKEVDWLKAEGRYEVYTHECISIHIRIYIRILFNRFYTKCNTYISLFATIPLYIDVSQN